MHRLWIVYVRKIQRCVNKVKVTEAFGLVFDIKSNSIVINFISPCSLPLHAIFGQYISVHPKSKTVIGIWSAPPKPEATNMIDELVFFNAVVNSLP